jgi:hypothetical protein
MLIFAGNIFPSFNFLRKLPKKKLGIFMYLTHLYFQHVIIFFHSHTERLDIIKVLSPTDAQGNCFKRSFKIYIKTAPT